MKEKFELENLFNFEIPSKLKDRIVECRDTHTFLKFNEAKVFIKTLHLQNREQYYRWHKKNYIVFLPYNPDEYYNK